MNLDSAGIWMVFKVVKTVIVGHGVRPGTSNIRNPEKRANETEKK